MRLCIKSFGPIKQAEIDLGPDLILIVGRNNIGKSYAISLLYAILKVVNRFRRAPYYFYDDEFQLGDRSMFNVARLSDECVALLKSSGATQYDVTERVEARFQTLVAEHILPLLQQSLNGTFSDIESLQNRNTSVPISIALEDERYLIDISVENSKLILRRCKLKGRRFIVRRAKQRRWPKIDGSTTIVYCSSEDESHLKRGFSSILRHELQEFVENVCGTVHTLHYLPASRSGLYLSLSAFGQIVAELSKSRTALRQRIILPGIPEPLSDYYLRLSEARPVTGPNQDSPYAKAAAEIELRILHGGVEFEPKTRRMLYKPEGIDLTLDLSSTSSMVSEISPIASYLKYILPRYQESIERSSVDDQASARHGSRKQLIFLEEPEAHLHPEIQVELIQILVKLLSTTETKIVITSHSNYIFSKCSNLLISGALKPSHFQAILFSAGEGGSTTTTLEVDRFGIGDENFSEIAEDLYEERRALIAKMNDV